MVLYVWNIILSDWYIVSEWVFFKLIRVMFYWIIDRVIFVRSIFVFLNDKFFSLWILDLMSNLEYLILELLLCL